MASNQDSGDGLSTRARRFLELRDPIMARWEKEIRNRIDGADAIASSILTNALPAFLENIAQALSPSHPRQAATSHNNTATAHGSERARMTRYGLDQVVHEYEILRESIEAELKGQLDLSAKEWAIIDRSIYRAIREAVKMFVAVQDDIRTKVAAALSHDMRTPLSLMINTSELMRTTRSLQSANRFAAKIESNGRRLESMMADLLDALVSNGGQNLPLTITYVDIADLLKNISKTYTQIKGPAIQLKADAVSGYWCEDSLRRAVENLINNAAKYGDGSDIELRASEVRGRLMLAVHNMGSPIPKERQTQLFDYFGKKNTVSITAGWGLGLPFVKRVAESHGGSIVVDSSLETGTTFMIDIPIDARPYVSDCDEDAGGADT